VKKKSCLKQDVMSSIINEQDVLYYAVEKECQTEEI